jgi:hypothetical protein
MIKTSFSFDAGLVQGFKRDSIQRAERAMLIATDRASRDALGQIRQNGSLKRLSNAIGHFSDLKKGSVFRFGSEGFSASGGLAIKTRNERTVGAIISFTEGAEILPVRGQWLWIATPELRIKRVGRKKITPALYRSGGFEQRLGPLVQIPGRHSGEALLIIKNVQTSIAGNRRPIRGARSGIARAGREQKQFIVAFVGIRRTSRTRQIDVDSIMRANADRVGDLFYAEMRKAT